jgi:flagellar basal body-associated protein FliL
MTNKEPKNPINIVIIIYIAIVIVVVIGVAIFWFGVPQFPSLRPQISIWK